MVVEPLCVAVACNRPTPVWARGCARCAVGSWCPLPESVGHGGVGGRRVRRVGGRHAAESVVGISLEAARSLAVGLVMGEKLRAILGQLGGVERVDQLERLVDVVFGWAGRLSVGCESVAVVVGIGGVVVEMPGILDVGDGTGLDAGRQFVQKVRDDPGGLSISPIVRIQVVVVVLVVGAVVADVDVTDTHTGIGHELNVVVGPIDERLLVGSGVATRHNGAENGRRRRSGAACEGHLWRCCSVVPGATPVLVDRDALNDTIGRGSGAGNASCFAGPRGRECHHGMGVP